MKEGGTESIVKLILDEFSFPEVSFAQTVTLCCPSDQVTVVIFTQLVKVVFFK